MSGCSLTYILGLHSKDIITQGQMFASWPPAHSILAIICLAKRVKSKYLRVVFL